MGFMNDYNYEMMTNRQYMPEPTQQASPETAELNAGRMPQQVQTVTICIDNQPFSCKPTERDCGAIKKRFAEISPKHCSLPDILTAIRSGKTICPAIINPVQKYNKEGQPYFSHCREGWKSQQLFMIDIDNDAGSHVRLPDGDYLTLPQALEICNQNEINLWFAYFSFSSCPEHERYRLAILLDSPVTDPQEREKIQKAFIRLFGKAADRSCTNADRIFYGSREAYNTDCIRYSNPDAINSKQIFLNLYKKQNPEPVNPPFLPTTSAPTFSIPQHPYLSTSSSFSSNSNWYQQFDALPDELLYFCNPDASYDEWIKITAAYKGSGGDIQTWAVWSQQSMKWKDSDIAKWKTLNGTNLAVLKNLAQETPEGQAYINNLIFQQEKAKQEFLAQNGQKKPKRKKSPVLPQHSLSLLSQEYPSFVDVQRNEKGEIVSLTVNPMTLAVYIRENHHFFFAKRNGSAEDNYLRYLYTEKGYYEVYSDFQFKGFIRKPIEDAGFFEQAKTRLINETFNQLSFDLDRFIPHSRLDENEDLINFQNGTLNIRTMEFREHSPNDIMTIQIPVDWNGTLTETPLFDNYMNQLTAGADSKEKTQCLLEFLGVAISNVKAWKFKQALFMVGAGNSGKSVFRRLMDMLLGEANIQSGTLRNLEDRFGTSALYGKRLYGSSDLSYATVSELAVFKQITGGDSINVEYKGKDAFPFVYNGVVVFTMNEMPLFGGDKGDHVYDRILPIICSNSIPPEQQDKELTSKLWAEREGIVHKAVMAMKLAVERGYFYTTPSSSLVAIAEYKKSNSLYYQFYLECCEERPQNDRFLGETAARLNELAKEWCKKIDERFCFKLNDFKRELTSRGINVNVIPKKVNGKTNRYYEYFKLTNAAKTELQSYDQLPYDQQSYDQFPYEQLPY